MKYFIYCRKSTDSEERQILSIEAQITELQLFAAKENLSIAASLCEAKTAKEPGRTVFAEMLSRIEAGEAQGILAWHPDRLARNSIDGGRIIYLLDTGKLQDLKFPTFWFDSTPQGKFMLNIAFGQSKYYVDNLSENVKRGQRAKLRKGIWPSFAPLGYLNNHKDKTIVLDPESAPLIKKAFEIYSGGDHTLRSITRLANNLGLRSYRGRPLSVSSIQRILINPIYYGVLNYNGEVFEGVHEPIISKELFDQAQKVMISRGKIKRKRKHHFAFSGLFKCGNCGCHITAERQKGHNYYRCTKKKQKCDEKYMREEDLIKEIKSLASQLSIPDDWAQKMLAELDCENGKYTESNQQALNELQAQKLDTESKMQKLLDFYLEGSVSLEEYQSKKQYLLNQKVQYQEKLASISSINKNRLEPIREFVQASQQAKILTLEPENQQLFSFLKNIGSNFILKGKKLVPELRAGWRVIAKNRECVEWRGIRDSNS